MFSFLYSHLYYLDVLLGTVVAVGLRFLNLIHHIYALGHFAEHGVSAIEVRCAAHGLIGFKYLRCKGKCALFCHLCFGFCHKLLLKLIDGCVIAFTTP